MFSSDIHALAQKVISLYGTRGLKIVTAESCTAGLLAAALTEIPGSSVVLERGFITYSNTSKIEVLGVRAETLQDYGAVSMEIAEEMAQGALEFSQAMVSISLTGIAGPDGGSATKPVGLVYIGIANRDGLVMHYKCEFKGDRQAVRAQGVQEALNLLITILDN